MSKIILITGGSSGIGKAITSFLSSKDDYIVYGTSRNIENHKNLNFNLIQLDVTSIDSINACIDKVISKHGKLDILINNAGVGITGPMEETPNEEIEKHFKTNLYGPINIMKKVLPHMRKNNSGLIINITSIVGHTGNFGQTNYSASKAGIVAFSKSLALEYAKKNITINCVSPGFIVSDMTNGIPEKIRNILLSKIPMGKMGSGDDVSNCVAFLSSDEASYITGETIHVNGGMYMAWQFVLIILVRL